MYGNVLYSAAYPTGAYFSQSPGTYFRGAPQHNIGVECICGHLSALVFEKIDLTINVRSCKSVLE